jgi:hypothetical protein
MMKLQGKGPTNRNSTQMTHFQFSSTNSYMHFNVYLCFVKSSTSKYPQPSLSFFLPQIKHTHTQQQQQQMNRWMCTHILPKKRQKKTLDKLATCVHTCKQFTISSKQISLSASCLPPPGLMIITGCGFLRTTTAQYHGRESEPKQTPRGGLLSTTNFEFLNSWDPT